MAYFKKLKEKAEEEKNNSPSLTSNQDLEIEVKPTPEPTPTPTPTPQTLKRESKIQKEVNILKMELSTLRRDLSVQVQDILDSLTARQTTEQTMNTKITYAEFVEHMISNRELGNHYSTYVKQHIGETTGTGRPKESNFKHIYMIYLDLP